MIFVELNAPNKVLKNVLELPKQQSNVEIFISLYPYVISMCILVVAIKM